MERLRAAVASLGVTLLASEKLASSARLWCACTSTTAGAPAEIIRALAACKWSRWRSRNTSTTSTRRRARRRRRRAASGQLGDAAQYILQKLSLGDVHRMVKGTNVPIAVIDSEIDAAHPDLEGAVTQRYDAVGAPDKPHPHGTGMAGAIAARQRLLGTAPAARLLAVHAFSTSAAKPESTTFNILKGINWAVRPGRARHQYELRRARRIPRSSARSRRPTTRASC